MMLVLSSCYHASHLIVTIVCELETHSPFSVLYRFLLCNSFVRQCTDQLDA